MFDCVQNWAVADNITALVFDTTASNTGKFRGATVRLHSLLQLPLFYFGCRHHVAEFLAKNPWHTIFGDDPSPQVQMFKKLKEVWSEVDTSGPIQLITIPDEDLHNELKTST